MNYVTTNIRIPENDYLRLKQEAAVRRLSLSAIVREKLAQIPRRRSNIEIKQLMDELAVTGRQLGKKLKGFNSVAAIRKMREEGKW